MPENDVRKSRPVSRLKALRDLLWNADEPLLMIFACLTVGIFVVAAIGLFLVIFSALSVADVQRIVSQLTVLAAITLVAAITVGVLAKSSAKFWILVVGLFSVGAFILPTNDLIRIALVAFRGETNFQSLFLGHDASSEGRKAAAHDRAVALHREVEHSRSLAACENSVDSVTSNECEHAIVETIARFLRSEEEEEMLHVVRDRGLVDLLAELSNESRRSRLLFDNVGNERFRSDLYFLRAEGLVRFLYDDIGSIRLSPTGDALLVRAGRNITSDGRPGVVPVETGITEVAGFYNRELEIGPSGNVLAFTVAETAGYTIDVIGFDGIDPQVELFSRDDDHTGPIATDDDGGSGLNSQLSINLDSDAQYSLDVSEYNGIPGKVLITFRPDSSSGA